MNTNKSTLSKFLVAILIALFQTITGIAQLATWTGSGGDGDWNIAANWDIGVPSEGIDALIGTGNTVNYSAPMTASGFGNLTLDGLLNVSAGGFNHGAMILVRPGGGNAVHITAGGEVNTSGNFSISSNAVTTISAGGTLTVLGELQVGSGATAPLYTSGGSAGSIGSLTNFGGTINALNTHINRANSSANSRLIILGGTNNLGNVVVRRAAGNPPPALGSEGFVVNGGLVNTASLDVGGPNGNSWQTMHMSGGTVTNTGAFTVRSSSTASRGSRFLQAGGLFVSEETDVRLRGAAANVLVIYSVTGGTNLVGGFVLTDPADTVGTVNITNAAKIYVGAGGFSMGGGTLSAMNIVLTPAGTFGAQADWISSVPMVTTGGSFDAADLDGTPRNITLAGVLSGSGALNKIGGGTLTLDAANTYSGNTLIHAGTLAIGAGGSIANSPQIIVAEGATFDVSVAGFTLGASRILGGQGEVAGDVAVASGGIIDPGNTSGTLTLANSLNLSGGAILHFDLPNAPGAGNDRLDVNGDLNVSGANTIEVVGGGSPGSVHALIQYGGNFSGSVDDFSLTGASGVLSNNPTLKTIYLVVQSSVRTPTNVVWVGNAVDNDWDTVNRTNWLNTGTGLLDYFVAGDHARFDATGAAHPIVNLSGNNAPASVTVDAAANYTFAGSGAIAGASALIKTNTGTLTVTAENIYTGATILGGGVLDAETLAPAGSPSSIGAAAADPNNLVFHGGTLRYSGGSVETDRGATFNAGGGTLNLPGAETVLTASGVFTGEGAVTKTGPGILSLNAGNNYSGGTIVEGGTLRVNVAGAAGSGPVTNQGSTLLVAGPVVSGAVNFGNQLHFEGVCTVDLNNVGANTALNGAWSGSGTVNIINQQSSARVLTVGGNGSGGGHFWNFSGTLNMGANDGTLRFNDGGGTGSGPNFGSSNAVFNLGTGSATFIVRNGGTLNHLGALLGGPNTRLSGRGSSSGIVTYSIGGKGIDSIFEGTIQDTDSNTGQLTSIIKVGEGEFHLSGFSTHTGSTTIEDGVLRVDGGLGNTLVTVNGGALAGGGSIAGQVHVQSGGTLSPGASIGQLTINNSLTLYAGSTTVMELNKATSSADAVSGLSSVSYGGTLVVTNLDGTLEAGDSFKLFDATPGNYFGAFDAIEPANPGAGLAWDASDLAVDGTLRIVGAIAPVISVSQSGNSVVLAGAGGAPNGTFHVLSSTDVSAPLSAWTAVETSQFDGAGNFSVSLPIEPGAPHRFYLLQIP